MMANGMEWPGIARGLPSAPYLPMRGPRIAAPQQRRHATDHVHDAGAGEVVVAGSCVEPAATPGPVHDDRVDQRRDEEAVDHVADLNFVRSAIAPDTMVAAVAANATWKMKNVEIDSGDAPGSCRRCRSPMNQPLVPMKSLPDPKAKREADRSEGEHADAEVHHVLHHDVRHALGSGETGLDQREPRLHEDHQDRCEQDEDVVQVRLHQRDRVLLLSSGRIGHQRDEGQAHADPDRDLGTSTTEHVSPFRITRRRTDGGPVFLVCHARSVRVARSPLICVEPAAC